MELRDRRDVRRSLLKPRKGFSRSMLSFLKRLFAPKPEPPVILLGSATLTPATNQTLADYFIEDIALEDSIKASRAEQIKKATLAQDNLETIAVIKSLLRTVPRKDLPEALYDFGCSDLCQKYFPNRSLKQLHLGRDI